MLLSINTLQIRLELSLERPTIVSVSNSQTMEMIPYYRFSIPSEVLTLDFLLEYFNAAGLLRKPLPQGLTGHEGNAVVGSALLGRGPLASVDFDSTSKTSVRGKSVPMW